MATFQLLHRRLIGAVGSRLESRTREDAVKPEVQNLIFLAYVMCPPEHKKWYDTVPKNVTRFRVEQCCIGVTYPSLNSDWADDEVCTLAAEHGHLRCIEIARQKRMGWSERTTAVVAREGNLGLLNHLVASGCPYDVTACIEAASTGQLECMMRLRSLLIDMYDPRITEMAAANGHLVILEYLFMNGCPPDEETMVAAARNGHVQCMRFCREVAEVEWTQQTMLAAAAHGHIHAMRYAYSHGYMADDSVCMVAALNGQFNCLQYSHRRGGRLNQVTSTMAASSGQLKCLDYCFRNGIGINVETVNAAAEKGQLEAIKYMHRRKYPWNKSTCHAAASRGHMRVLKYLDLNGCPMDKHCYLAYHEFLHMVAERKCRSRPTEAWYDKWYPIPKNNTI